MALDHFVPQVHLKNFYSPALRRLRAIRKSALKFFTPLAQDVCRIEEGSTNSYLLNDRAIEEFLRYIEPKYNYAIQRVASGPIDEEVISVIAGYAAYVSMCSPAAARIFSTPLQEMVKSTANILEERGHIPESPSAFGGRTLKELLNSGAIQVRVDPKYPQSIGISGILEQTTLLGNCHWEILVNEERASPFFTSDFPIGIERRADDIINHILPLGPSLAVRILPDRGLRRSELDASFSRFRYRRRKLASQEIKHLNRLIVQCAETLVFFRDDLSWIRPFVTKNRHFQVQATTHVAPQPHGILHLSRLNIIQKR
jgi:hypothetical protein